MKKNTSKNRGRIGFIVAFATVTVLLSLFAVFYKLGYISLSEIGGYFTGFFERQPEESVQSSPDLNEEQPSVEAALDLPSFMKGIVLDVNEEIDLSQNIYGVKNQIKEKIVYYKGLGINTCIYKGEFSSEISKVITETLKENNIYSYAVYSLKTEETITEQNVYKLSHEIKDYYASFSPNAILFDEYFNVANENLTKTELIGMTHKRLAYLQNTIKTLNPNVAVGLISEPVGLYGDFGASEYFQTEEEGYFNVSHIADGDEPDLIIVKAPFSLKNSSVPYEKMLDYWSNLSSQRGFKFCTLLYNENLFANSSWSNPVEIVQQLIASTQRKNYSGVAFNSFESLIANKKSSTSALIKYINEDIDAETIFKELTISEPISRNFTTSEERVLFMGTTDQNFEVLINGTPAARNDSGLFALYVDLKVGTNKITFEHKGKSVTYTITRSVIVLKDVSPTSKVTLDGGTVLSLEATAYRGSTVTATIAGKRITLQADAGSTSAGTTAYQVYRGSYTLPESTDQDVNLGAISFYGNYNGISGSKTGATVIVKKKPVVVSPSEPGNMIRVKNSNLPFTYSGLSTYYYPCPDQSFLPVGTMDYVDGEPFVIYDGSTSYTFVKTRSGKRFQTKDVENLSTRDMGNNTIKSVSCQQSGTYLSFNFDMNWNIPFNITAEGITYRKNSYQDFYITSYNANKVVITFDYTVSVESFTLPDNGLFTSYHWEKTMNGANEAYKLVLTLKNKNCYTGYVTSYTSEGKLNIKFNAPLSVQETQNEYGGTLEGAVIALSAGHGGWDPGALGTHNGVAYREYDLNAGIVAKLKAELEKAGATVVICDAVSNNKPDYRARSNQATAAGAQIHIAIHQNSAGSTATGFETWYYSPQSYQAGNYLLDAMESFYKTTLYPSSYNKLMRRGNFFSWISDTMYPTCPTVLIETGFISNPTECIALNDPAKQELLAKELTKGIVNYAKAQK